MTEQKFLINSKQEMTELAAKIASGLTAPCIVALKGTLGMGKSFFARQFINSLKKPTQPGEISVLSPTFNLVYSYETTKGEIFHFDLYRLKTPEELENIGFFDAIKNSICLIEWPEIATEFLQKLPSENYIEIEISAEKTSEESRIVTIKQKK